MKSESEQLLRAFASEAANPSPSMGEGGVGVMPRDDRGQMKKQPGDGARVRAKALRREMTEAEKRIWHRLRRRQTEGYRFRRQVPLGRFMADFVCHEARLIIEIDGGQHEPSSEKEARRTRFLETEGYRVLRFWNNEVLERTPLVCRGAIAQHLRRHHPHPNPPPSKGEG